MQCPKCSSHPKLSIAQNISDTPKFCYACGIIISQKKGYIMCNSCKKVNICSNCKICPQAHALSKVYFLNKLPNLDEDSLYADNQYNCDSCGMTIKVGVTGVWHCKPCEYDICDKCLKD